MYSHTVEIGHTYAPERFLSLAPERTPSGAIQFVDDERAQRLRALATGIAGRTLRVALLDDVVAMSAQNRSNEDGWRHALFIGVSSESLRVGTQADVLQGESTFVHAGRDIIETIRDMELPEDYRLSDDTSKIVQGSGKSRVVVPLTGFQGIDDPEHPSCSVLDLAWTQYRQTLAPNAVTFIDETYQTQQRQVATLARLFPAMMEQGTISSVFIDQQQRPISEMRW